MFKIISFGFLFLMFTNSLFSANRYWISAVNGNWNDVNNWSTSSSGIGGASVPTVGDNVLFTSNGLGNCTIDVAASFDGLNTTGYTGTIDLNGFGFNPSASGSASIVLADLTLSDTPGTTTLAYSTTGQTAFNSGTFNIPINLVCGRIDFNGGLFNNPVEVEDNGGSSANGAGGCIFNSTLDVLNSGTSYFLMGQTNPDIFNGDVTLINTSTSRIRMAYSAVGTQFNGDIIVGCSAGSGIWFGETGGTCSLAAGKTISIDPLGFNLGDLRLKEFVQNSATAQNLTLTGTAVLRIQDGSVFNGNVNFISPRIYLDGSTFNGTSEFEKTGSGSDASIGGNTFALDAIVTNSGPNYFLLGSTNPDDFQGNLTINNLGLNNCYLAHNSIGNVVSGNLTIVNSPNGTNGNTYVCTSVNSSLSISGNCTITNSPIASAGSVYLGENGDITLTGDLLATNSPANLSGSILIGNQVASSISISGNTDLVNTGTQTTSRIYFGNQGSIQQSGLLTIKNNSTASNSQIYCNHGVNSSNNYLESIEVESTQDKTDGVFFGSGNGVGTLAATKTISIGLGGFSAGTLELRNFTATGATTQTLTLTDTSRLLIRESIFGGDIDFKAPRITISGSSVNGSADIEKTAGIGNDLSYGGNKFIGDFTLTNSGGSYLGMAQTNPDSCMADVFCYNSGEDRIYLFYNSANNYVGGNLLANNTGSGSNTGIYIGHTGTTGSFNIVGNCSVENNATSTSATNVVGNNFDFTIGGNLSAINNGTGTTANFYVGNSGSFSISGTATLSNTSMATNATFYVANSSTSSGIFGDACTIVNSGGLNSKQFYLGNNGDIILNGTVSIKNSSSAVSSRVYVNSGVNASSQFNESIILECDNVDADGILFGASNGTATLAAGKTISIGPLGFIAGNLQLRNFLQTGNTAQTLLCTGTSSITVYDSQWNGDISFTSPRISTRGTSYAETAYLEKTGAINDASVGGNSFAKDCELKNTGSGYFLMSNGAPDTWAEDLTMNNFSEYNLYIGYNSIGNSIAGDLLVNHATVGTGSAYTYIGTATLSTLSITGNCTLNMTGTSNNNYISLAESGTVTIGGDLTYTSSGGGSNAELRAAFNSSAQLNITGNTLINNFPVSTTGNSYLAYNGTVNITGDLTINHGPVGNNGNFNISSGATSSLEVDGDFQVTNTLANGVTKRITIGSQGDITCNGTFTVINNSNATNNEINCNSGASSTGVYNENIVLETSGVDGDGILFGNSGGQATLAATKTVSIGSGGFIAGNLTFRNFNQIGNTAQNITITGTAAFTNRDSDWGGDVDFRGPRMYTIGTHYRELSFLEKTGEQSDASTGGNTFDKDCELKNSGTGYFLLGNGAPDIWGEDLFVNNTGEHQMYIAHNSSGNTIGGDFTISNTSTGAGASTHIHVSNGNGSDLKVIGTTTVTNSSSSNSHYIYLGRSGSIDFMDDVTITQNSNGNVGAIEIASSSNSTVDIDGDLTILNNASDNNAIIYLGSNGTVNISGDLSATHTPTGVNGNLYLANGTTSTITVTGNSTITGGTSGGTTKRLYVGNNGTTNFNGTLSLINQGNATNSVIYCNNGSSAIGNYNDNIFIECSNANGDGIYFGNGNGIGTLAATKTVSLTAGGFVSGQLYFRNFTQIGSTPQSLILTGTAYLNNYNSDWGGTIDFRAPRLRTFGTHYNDVTYLEKTGSNNDLSQGNNIFDEDTELRNSGSGYFGMGQTNPDTWNKNLTINNLGSNNFYLAFSSLANIVSGDIIINNDGTGTSNVTYVCSNASSSLNVVGSATVNNIGSAATSLIYYGGSGDITTNGKAIFYNNTSVNNGQLIIGSSNGSNMIFNDTVIGTNDIGGGTTQRLYLGSGADIVLNEFVQLNNNSIANNAEIYCNYGSTGFNHYNENIEINNATTSPDGIFFGRGSGIGELATGKSIMIGSAGFTNGTLYFRNFTQLGNTPQSLTITGTGRIENYNSTWNGNVDFRGDDHYTRETIYNGTAYLEKNGPINNASGGGNIFNEPTIFQNNGSGYFMPANGIGNDFNSDVTFTQNGSGLFFPCYNSSSTFAGNISVDVPGVIYFGAAGNGRAIIDGTTPQNLNATGLAPNIRFRDLQTNNSSDEITLNTRVEIITELDLDQGNIITDATNFLYMGDNAVVSSVSDDSYVDGPITKRGNDVFDFPVGKAGYYRPISISAPPSSSAEFQAEYLMTDPHPTYNHSSSDPTIQHISSCEYWILDRLNTTSSVNVTLSWNENTSCGVDQLSELLVARWDGIVWKDEGNGGTTGTTANGSVVTSSAVTSFSPFTLASTTFNNPLPIELLSLNAIKEGSRALILWETASETNNDYFEIQSSTDGINYKKIGVVNGAGNSSLLNKYNFFDENPEIGINYYRLKQVDFDGTYHLSESKSLDFFSNFDNEIILFPNPTATNSACKIINRSKLAITRVETFNELGAIVNSQPVNENESKIDLEIGNLSSGIYTLRIICNKGVITKKLIIQ